MERLSNIPRNYIVSMDLAQYYEFNSSFMELTNASHLTNDITIQPKTKARFKFTIVIEPESDEDLQFVQLFKSNGLEFVAHQGLDIQKLRYVINEGYQRLPILLKHKDPEIAKLAWILSKYFAQRNDIMPKQVVE